MKFMMKNNSALFFTFSLIEYIGRIRKLSRDKVVDYLGKDVIERIYKYADDVHIANQLRKQQRNILI